MKRSILVLLSFIFSATPAFAAKQCYSPLEYKAEQWVRLHSELMVITVTCKQGSRGDDLVSFYTGFTKRHLPILQQAEQVLIKHYKAEHSGNGLEQMDEVRTKLANEYGQKIADQGAPMFCSLYRDKVIDMYGSTSENVEREVEGLMRAGKSYETQCKQ